MRERVNEHEHHTDPGTVHGIHVTSTAGVDIWWAATPFFDLRPGGDVIAGSLGLGLGGRGAERAAGAFVVSVLGRGQPWETSKLSQEVPGKYEDGGNVAYELSERARMAVGQMREMNAGLSEEGSVTLLGSDLTEGRPQ